MLTIRQRIESIVTQYDIRRHGKKNYNPYALAQYLHQAKRIDNYVRRGGDLREAVISYFCDKLCDTVLAGLDLAEMTEQEEKYGCSLSR